MIDHIRSDDGVGCGLVEDTDCNKCKSKRSVVNYYDHCTCRVCGNNPIEDFKTDVVRKFREKLGIRRKEMAAILGVTRGTLKNYEWLSPSKKVFYKMLRLMRYYARSVNR